MIFHFYSNIFLFLRWLCVFFDKALTVVLARAALAMCLQIALAFSYYSFLFSFLFTTVDCMV